MQSNVAISSYSTILKLFKWLTGSFSSFCISVLHSGLIKCTYSLTSGSLALCDKQQRGWRGRKRIEILTCIKISCIQVRYHDTFLKPDLDWIKAQLQELRALHLLPGEQIVLFHQPIQNSHTHTHTRRKILWHGFVTTLVASHSQIGS